MSPLYRSLLLTIVLATTAHAQGHAPYSTLYYQTPITQADILVNEVRPTIAATYTYYNVLGWTGGYTGLQLTEGGEPAYIFSLWDPPGTESKPSVGAVFSAPGGTVDRFGGEGTGLHYMNHRAAWQMDRWYRFVVRCWDNGNTTRYALWTQDETTGLWIHQTTLETPQPHFRFGNFVYSFLEDWQGTPDKTRRVEYRGALLRATSGTWSHPASASYSVDPNLTHPGPFANAFDAGVHADTYFIQSGGDTRPSTPAKATFTPTNSGPATPNTPQAAITNLSAHIAKGTIAATWALDPKTTPQFAYKLQLFNNPQGRGTPLAESPSYIAPDDNSATLNTPVQPNLYLKLSIIDVFDRVTTAVVPVSR